MVVPTGMFSLPLNYAVETFAAAVGFQIWVGEVDATGAKSHIFVIEKETPTALDLPFMVLDWADDFERATEFGGARNFFNQSSGKIMAIFRGAITESAVFDKAYEFMNPIGDIWRDVEALSGRPGNLDIRRWRMIDGPSRPTEDEEKALGYDFYQAVFEIEWMAN